MKIFLEYEDAMVPKRALQDDAGLDVYAYEEATIQPGERKLVEIGVRIIAPKGHYYTFAPRSSLAFKHNVIPSHHNVMDDGYTGNCAVLMHNRGDKPYTIKRFERFCQVIVYEVPKCNIELITKEQLRAIKNDRRERGFGSSGN